MLLLAHAGITLGAATVLAGAAKFKKKSGNGILTWFAVCGPVYNHTLLSR